MSFSNLVLCQCAVYIIRDKYALFPRNVAVVTEDAFSGDFFVDEFLGADFYETEFPGDFINDRV